MVLTNLNKGSFEIDGVNMDLYDLTITTRPTDFIPFYEFEDYETPFSNNPSENNKGVMKNEPLTLTVINRAKDETVKELSRQGFSNAINKGYHNFRFSFRPGVLYRARLSRAITIDRFLLNNSSYEIYEVELSCKPLKYLSDPILTPVTSGVSFNIRNEQPLNFFLEPKIILKGLSGTPDITIVINGVSYVFSTTVNLTNADVVIDCAEKVVYSPDLKTRYSYNCPLGFPRLSGGDHSVAITSTATEILFNKNEVLL